MLIAICDDDKEFACELDQKIRSRFARFDEDNLLFNTLVFHSSKNLKEYLLQREHLEIDILFLDISMPEIDGFDIAELCFQLFPDISIVFVSDYEDRVFYSLRFRPFRFLCKKDYKKYLPEALDAAIKLHAKAQRNILVKTENEYLSIKIKQIVYVEKEIGTNYIKLHLKDSVYRYRSSLNDIFQKLSSQDFVKTDSGTLVSLQAILSLNRSNSSLVLNDGSHLHISRKTFPEVLKKYTEYIREN